MKPVEEMSLEEIAAERASIARQRAELAAEQKTVTLEAGYMIPPPDVYDAYPTLESGLLPMDLLAEPGPEPEATFEYPAEAIEGAFVEAAAAAAQDAEEESTPKPWPHEHLSYLGLELDVRMPNQSALMAISMLQQLDGHAELQMEIFNTFLSNHLAPASLAAVIKEMTRPDTELGMQGLVQALVNLRINAA